MRSALPPSLMSTLVEESIDSVLIIDEHCVICYANPAMQRLSGYAGEDLPGKPLDMLLPGTISSCHADNVRIDMPGQEMSAMLGQVREFSIRHRDGSKIPIELKAIDLGQHQGTRYFGAFIEDIRQRRRLEAEHAALLARLEQEAMTDALTGIANRRAFEGEAARLIARARRSGTSVAIGIADIDHFKVINDEHGHPIGDDVLRSVAQRMIDAARSADFVARIGGEEFGLLFPNTDAATATGIAQRIREAIASNPIIADDGCEICVTISIGLAGMTPGTTLDEALAAADSALYAAKDGGRNRVETA